MLDDILGDGKKTMFIDGYPFSLELSRGQQGKVGWTVKMKGDEPDKVIDKIKRIDTELYAFFKPEKEVRKDAGKKTTV